MDDKILLICGGDLRQNMYDRLVADLIDIELDIIRKNGDIPVLATIVDLTVEDFEYNRSPLEGLEFIITQIREGMFTRDFPNDLEEYVGSCFAKKNIICLHQHIKNQYTLRSPKVAKCSAKRKGRKYRR